MRLTSNHLVKIIQEELKQVLKEQETKESLIQKIDEMADYLGVSSDYSSLEVGQEVIEAAASFINENPADNVFDTDLDYLKPDEIGDWEDEVLNDEESYNDPSMSTNTRSNPEFIFALYAGYYYDQI